MADRSASTQRRLNYATMSGTELKKHIRQISRLLVKPGLDADLVATKNKQLTALQTELAKRPPSHIVVQENIRKIKEQNQKHKLKNRTITYIELHKAHKKVKEGENTIAELEKELIRRQNGEAVILGEASEPSSSKKSKGDTSGDDSSSQSNEEEEETGASTKMDVDESSGHASQSKGDEEEDEEEEKEDLKDLTDIELKTRLGLAKHHLKKAKDDVVYVTFYPVKDHKYISLYPSNEPQDLQLRTKLRRQILQAHTYEEALSPAQSKKKWEERGPNRNTSEFKKSDGEDKDRRDQNGRQKQKKSKEEDKEKDAKEKEAVEEKPETPKLNRKARRAAAAEAAGKVQFGTPEASDNEDQAGEDFFFDTKEEADAAAVESKKKTREKLEANNAAQKAASEAKKAAVRELAEERSRKGGFQAPEDDVITASDFFGDDHIATGRMADPAWEAQQARAQRTGDRQYRFMPNAPEYLTSRGKKRALETTPEDGFTKKPWEAQKESESRSDRPHQFRGRGGFRGGRGGSFRGGRGGSGAGDRGHRGDAGEGAESSERSGFSSFRGGRGGYSGSGERGGRGGSSSFRGGRGGFSAPKQSFVKTQTEAPVRAPIDPSAPPKKVRSRPKKKE